MLPESSARAELSLYDINTLREAMRTDYQIPAVEGDYICGCHPRVIYGKNWRKVLRRIKRARRRWVKLDCRVSSRCYSDSAHFYRARVRGWVDDEKFSVTRAWLDRLRANTIRNASVDMLGWRMVRRYYPGRLPEPPKKYGKGRRRPE